MSTTRRDGNDNIFPVAIAIVDQENKESWSWFLWLFIENIDRLDDIGLVFILDIWKVYQYNKITF